MKLEGKSLEMFETYLFSRFTFDYCEDYEEWYRLTDFSMQYGVLVDFFDSVGINISIEPDWYCGKLEVKTQEEIENALSFDMAAACSWVMADKSTIGSAPSIFT